MEYMRQLDQYFTHKSLINESCCRKCGQRICTDEHVMLEHLSSHGINRLSFMNDEETKVATKEILNELIDVEMNCDPIPTPQRQRFRKYKKRPTRDLTNNNDEKENQPMSSCRAKTTQKRPLAIAFNQPNIYSQRPVKKNKASSDKSLQPISSKVSLLKTLNLDPPPSTEKTIDTHQLARDLTVVCLLESTNPSLITSPFFDEVFQATYGYTLPTDHIPQFLKSTLAQAITRTKRVINETIKPLTLVVKATGAMDATSTYMSFYVINQERESTVFAIVPMPSSTTWLDVIQVQYERLVNTTSVPVHVCIGMLPPFMVPEIPMRLKKYQRYNTTLVSTCLATQASWLFKSVIELVGNVPELIEQAVQVAQLVNRMESMQIRLIIPRLSKHDGLGRFGILLQQLSDNQSEIDTRSKQASVNDELHRLLEKVATNKWQLLDEVAQWMAPIAIVEALTRGTSSIVVTSGVLVCLELWLWHLVEKSEVLTSNQKHQWKQNYVTLQRSSRWQHQLVSLLLDPRIRGAGLSQAGHQAVTHFSIQYLAQLDGFSTEIPHHPSSQRLQSQLTSFLSQSHEFGRPSLWRKETVADPFVFWSRCNWAPELQKVALVVCGCIPFCPLTFDELKPLTVINNVRTLTEIGQLKQEMLQMHTSAYTVDHSLAIAQLLARDVVQFNNSSALLDTFESYDGNARSYGTSFGDLLHRMGHIEGACRDDRIKLTMDPSSLYLFKEEWIECTETRWTHIQAAMRQVLSRIGV